MSRELVTLWNITVRSTRHKIRLHKLIKELFLICVRICSIPKMSILIIRSLWNIMSLKLKIGSESIKINKVNLYSNAFRIKCDQNFGLILVYFIGKDFFFFYKENTLMKIFNTKFYEWKKHWNKNEIMHDLLTSINFIFTWIFGT